MKKSGTSECVWGYYESEMRNKIVASVEAAHDHDHGCVADDVFTGVGLATICASNTATRPSIAAPPGGATSPA